MKCLLLAAEIGTPKAKPCTKTNKDDGKSVFVYS
jgi:hypothetical protein